MPARRKPKDKYHHGDLRRALLEAARAELRAVGWRELSLRSVARRVGVTHTAAYHHFNDKRDLLATIAVDGLVRLYEMVDAEIRDVVDPIDRLCAASLGYVKMAFEDPTAFELMFVVNYEARDMKLDKYLAGKPNAFEQLMELVRAARATIGVGDDDDLLASVMLHWEMVHGIAMLALSGQHKRLGIETLAHTRWVADRLRALYARPAPAMIAGSF